MTEVSDQARPVDPPMTELHTGPAIPPARRLQLLVGDWHRRHRSVMQAVNKGWLEALRANQRVLWKDPARECGALLEVLESPGVEGLYRAPDPVLRLHLGRSLDELKAAAAACARGRYFEGSHRFREAGKAFLEAGAQLSRYGLRP